MNGNFTDSVSNATDYEGKQFSMESKHHEAGGKPTSFKFMKSKTQANLTNLEGNSKIISNELIENEQNKWSEICLQACEGQDLTVLDLQTLNDVVDSSRNMLDLINLTTGLTEKGEDIQEHQNVNFQYNHFWLSFAQHVKTIKFFNNKLV